MAVITISRQYGSGGDEIAALVCDQLGYRHFDKRLMARVAAEVKLSASEMAEFSEDNARVRNFLDRLTGLPVPRAGVQAAKLKLLDENKALALVQGAIEASYQQGNVVIVGRGGQAILKDKRDVLHVRIEAPFKLRRQRIHEEGGVSLEVAHDVVIEHDHAVADYLKRFYGIDWADPILYDLVINTGKLSLDAAAQLIVMAVRCLPASPSH